MQGEEGWCSEASLGRVEGDKPRMSKLLILILDPPRPLRGLFWFLKFYSAHAKGLAVVSNSALRLLASRHTSWLLCAAKVVAPHQPSVHSGPDWNPSTTPACAVTDGNLELWESLWIWGVRSEKCSRNEGSGTAFFKRPGHLLSLHRCGENHVKTEKSLWRKWNIHKSHDVKTQELPETWGSNRLLNHVVTRGLCEKEPRGGSQDKNGKSGLTKLQD